MDKKIDLHTHILPGVDDGAENINDSIEIINYLASQGFTDLVLTSHYIKNTSFNSDRLTRSKIFVTLSKVINNSNINLYLGNEIYISEDILDLLKTREICPINNSKYLLIELPMSGYMNNLQDILCDVTDKGYIPIIAHPERYSFLQKDNKRVRELLEFNCLFQCNIESLTGKYGRSAKKLIKWLLKNNLVNFVATDIHCVGNSKDLEKAYQKLKKLVGENKYHELIYSNPKKVLNDEEVESNLEYLIKEENH